MKVKEFIKTERDIDVYDDVCEELAIAFCGPMELTPAGAEKFAEVLGYEIEVFDDCAIVKIDGENWGRKLRKAREFFESAAGYCAADDFDLWFSES